VIAPSRHVPRLIVTMDKDEPPNVGNVAIAGQGGELRIAELDQDGVGEIELRGPNVFRGYLNDPQADQAAFTSDG
jgi:long-chain acyl-CoA synthetase